MNARHDPSFENSPRWEDFVDNRLPDSRLRMARSVIGLPHWALESGAAHALPGSQTAMNNVRASTLKAASLALISTFARLFEAVGKMQGRQSGIRNLARLDERLLRDIGLEPLDIVRLEAGESTLEELNARRRFPEVYGGVVIQKSADVVALPHEARLPTRVVPVRDAA